MIKPSDSYPLLGNCQPEFIHGGGTDTGAMVTKDPKAPKAEKADAGLLVAIEPTKKTKKKNNCWFEECISRLMTCVYNRCMHI